MNIEIIIADVLKVVFQILKCGLLTPLTNQSAAFPLSVISLDRNEGVSKTAHYVRVWFARWENDMFFFFFAMMGSKTVAEIWTAVFNFLFFWKKKNWCVRYEVNPLFSCSRAKTKHMNRTCIHCTETVTLNSFYLLWWQRCALIQSDSDFFVLFLSTLLVSKNFIALLSFHRVVRSSESFVTIELRRKIITIPSDIRTHRNEEGYAVK